MFLAHVNPLQASIFSSLAIIRYSLSPNDSRAVMLAIAVSPFTRNDANTPRAKWAPLTNSLRAGPGKKRMRGPENSAISSANVLDAAA